MLNTNIGIIDRSMESYTNQYISSYSPFNSQDTISGYPQSYKPKIRTEPTMIDIDGFKLAYINPGVLVDSQITKIHELIQDIWADGTGEFLRCKKCSHIHSKRDIFSSLIPEEYNKTVAELLNNLENPKITCLNCGGDTEILYGESTIDILKKKYRNSVDSFLVLLPDSRGGYAGFAEGYVDTFENIYKNDLEAYYQKIGIDTIKRRIEKVLGTIPEKMVIFSGIGIRNGTEFSGRRLMTGVFALLNTLFQNMEKAAVTYPGIMLLDKSHLMHHIFTSCKGLSLDMDKYADLGKIQNLPESYQSDLMVFRDPIATFRRELGSSPSAFFRRNRVNNVNDKVLH